MENSENSTRMTQISSLKELFSVLLCHLWIEKDRL